MTVFVQEYDRYPNYGILPNPLRSYALSSGSSGLIPSTGARYVGITADAATFFSAVSTSSLTSLTSTNSTRVPANAMTLIACSTRFALQSAST